MSGFLIVAGIFWLICKLAEDASWNTNKPSELKNSTLVLFFCIRYAIILQIKRMKYRMEDNDV